MSYELSIKEKALSYRRQGYSLNEIADRMSISKSTLSGWFEDLVLNKSAIKRLKERKIFGQYTAKQKSSMKRRSELKKYEKQASGQIRKVVFTKNSSKLLCSILFWCEGTKSLSAPMQFINSDPAMIRVFMLLLRDSFELDETKFRILVHLHEYHNEEKQKKFWSDVTGVPINQFSKIYWKFHTEKRKRDNYPGCIRITYYDVKIARQSRAWYNVFACKYRPVV